MREDRCLKPVCAGDSENRRNIVLVAQELRAHGWAVLTGHGAESADAFNALMPEIFHEFPLQHESRVLRPHDRSAAPTASMSSFTGLSAQPPHTDGAHKPRPPRYVMLKCLNPGESDCPTVVATLDWNRLDRDWPQALARRDWVIQGSPSSPFYGSVLERGRGNFSRVRFDRYCMRAPRGTQSAQEIADDLMRYATTTKISYQTGECLLLDNWRVLHGRAEGAAHSPSRRLQRWISRG